MILKRNCLIALMPAVVVVGAGKKPDDCAGNCGEEEPAPQPGFTVKGDGHVNVRLVMRIISLILLVCFAFSGGSRSLAQGLEQQPPHFDQAEAVWAKGRETEKNLTLGFRGVFHAGQMPDPILKITASTLYRVFINGVFLGYGPARASHGYYRIDEYDLSPYLRKGDNIVAVEVVGYNVNTFYVLDQPAFLQAEVIDHDEVILATGTVGGFEAFELESRVQKVARYSFQRPFIEYYRLDKGFDRWKFSTDQLNTVLLAAFPDGRFLNRNLALPDFRVSRPKSVVHKGTIRLEKGGTYLKDRSLTQVGELIAGYPEDSLVVRPTLIMQEMVTQRLDSIQGLEISQTLNMNEFYTVDFGTNLSGFIGSKIVCEEPSTIYFTFDEILLDGEVNPKKRMSNINNVIGYELQPGEYDLESFEAYTFRYLRMTVLKGNCRIQHPYIREYAYPENEMVLYKSDDEGLNKIFEASKQTFRQNSVDLFMDCPSRERAGWLCDSRFMAIVEKQFTGRDDIAYNFYENYYRYTPFDNLPKGMVPMVYPADNRNGNFIPNWALWFVIQVKEFADRGGDSELVAKLQPRVMGVLDYFVRFENEYGLLEDLEGWKFVEWSKANQFVNGVNYPTNMLYSSALSCASVLYGIPVWEDKAQKVAQAVRDQSFDGEFFVDNAIRDAAGKLKPTSNISEVAQYYAFFFDVATPASHAGLWRKLIGEFGPNRDDQTVYPRVFKANAFIGNYLRMEVLYRYGMSNQMLREMQGYFLDMADLTGTLWEHMDTHASCNHGFASYLGHLLYQGALGIKNIDYIKKEVTLRFDDTYLTACEGAIPIGNERIYLQWEKSGNELRYRLNLPEEYAVTIQNAGEFEIMQIE